MFEELLLKLEQLKGDKILKNKQKAIKKINELSEKVMNAKKKYDYYDMMWHNVDVKDKPKYKKGYKKYEAIYYKLLALVHKLEFEIRWSKSNPYKDQDERYIKNLTKKDK